MSRLTRPLAAVSVAAGAFAATSAVIPLVSGLGPPALLVRSASGAVFVAAGVVTWARGASRRLGWLFVLAGCALCLVNLTLWPGPVLTTLRVLSGGYALFGAILVHLLLAYPTGRLPHRLDRVTVGWVYASTACYMAGQYLLGDADGQRWCEPVGCSSIGPAPIRSDGAAAALPIFMLVAFSVALVLLTTTVVRGWVGAGPSERRSRRPVVLSLVATCGLGITSGAVRLLVLDSHGLVRVAISLVWGVTVAAVAVNLLAGVLRNRLVVYGMGGLVSQLAPGRPGPQLQAVLARLLKDPSVQLVRTGPNAASFVGLDGVQVAPAPGRTWLALGDPPVGAIVYDASVQPDPGVVHAVVGALRLALDNLQLQDRLREQLAEVDASRARILQASDLERRRIERDLHDGAQQHLVASAVTVQRARQHLRTDPETAERLLLDADDQLRFALREIRDLARGLHPAVLADAGIGAAVESLADRLPVRVGVADGLDGRYPFLVETTAYFVVCEALVNVVKHAGTDAAVVRLGTAGGCLLVEVADEGRGGARVDRFGSGLLGLADRVAAVGGRFEVSSPVGCGTTVRAELGLGPAQNPRASLAS